MRQPPALASSGRPGDAARRGSLAHAVEGLRIIIIIIIITITSIIIIMITLTNITTIMIYLIVTVICFIVIMRARACTCTCTPNSDHCTFLRNICFKGWVARAAFVDR